MQNIKSISFNKGIFPYWVIGICVDKFDCLIYILSSLSNEWGIHIILTSESSYAWAFPNFLIWP